MTDSVKDEVKDTCKPVLDNKSNDQVVVPIISSDKGRRCKGVSRRSRSPVRKSRSRRRKSPRKSRSRRRKSNRK